jgi:hypothetical protein
MVNHTSIESNLAASSIHQFLVMQGMNTYIFQCRSFTFPFSDSSFFLVSFFVFFLLQPSFILVPFISSLFFLLIGGSLVVETRENTDGWQDYRPTRMNDHRLVDGS